MGRALVCVKVQTHSEWAMGMGRSHWKLGAVQRQTMWCSCSEVEQIVREGIHGSFLYCIIDGVGTQNGQLTQGWAGRDLLEKHHRLTERCYLWKY